MVGGTDRGVPLHAGAIPRWVPILLHCGVRGEASMAHYSINIAPVPEGEVQVVLQGPGITPTGRPYVFKTMARASSFAEAVNFAYEQGVRDGMRQAYRRDDTVIVVSGRTPDNLHLRRERRLERVRRWWRG